MWKRRPRHEQLRCSRRATIRLPGQLNAPKWFRIKSKPPRSIRTWEYCFALVRQIGKRHNSIYSERRKGVVQIAVSQYSQVSTLNRKRMKMNSRQMWSSHFTTIQSMELFPKATIPLGLIPYDFHESITFRNESI